MHDHEPTEAVAHLLDAVARADVDEVVRRLDAEPHLVEATGSHWPNHTPLWAAAAGKGHVRLERLLIGRGADIDASTSYGWRPLHEAAARGREEIGLSFSVVARIRAGRTVLVALHSILPVSMVVWVWSGSSCSMLQRVCWRRGIAAVGRPCGWRALVGVRRWPEPSY